MQMFVHFIFLASLQIFTSVIFATANGTYTLRYDANGNLIKRASVQNGQNRQLIWDEENRLACTLTNQQGFLPQSPDSCKAQGNSNAPTFTYDAAGVRVAKNGGALSLTINQNYSEKANKAYKHIFVGTQRLVTKLVGNNSKKLEGAQWYYHGDHLSSSSYVTNADGAIVEHLSYFPYGETWVQEKSSLPINYGFTAKELDEETGYYYFGARYYDPRVSTWISPDPALGEYLGDLKSKRIYDSKSLSLYSYAANNPLTMADPDGNIVVFAGDFQAYFQNKNHKAFRSAVMRSFASKQGRQLFSKLHADNRVIVVRLGKADGRPGKINFYRMKNGKSVDVSENKGENFSYAEIQINPEQSNTDLWGSTLVHEEKHAEDRIDNIGNPAKEREGEADLHSGEMSILGHKIEAGNNEAAGLLKNKHFQKSVANKIANREPRKPVSE